MGDGGGVDRAARVRREQVRRQAAYLFRQGVPPVEVARRLGVSKKSAYQWRRIWRAGGAAALASKGASGPDPKLSDAQLALLRSRLEWGSPAAGHREERCWTLARIAALIGAMFGVRVGVTTTWEAMRRIGFEPRPPIPPVRTYSRRRSGAG